MTLDYEPNQSVVIRGTELTGHNLTESNSESILGKQEVDLAFNRSYNLHRQRAQRDVLARIDQDACTDIHSDVEYRGVWVR